MDEARLIKDYVDVLVWPVLVFAVFIVSVTRFRDQIAEAILRVRSVKALGAEALLEGQLSAEPEVPPPAVEAGPAEEVMNAEQAHFENEVTRVQGELWQAQTDLYHERVYRNIYGTQIALLQDLNQRPAGIPVEEVLTSHFQRHVDAGKIWAPAYQGNFTNYIDFLTSWGLIQHLPAGIYHITAAGRGFLTYLTALGIPVQKAL